MVCLVFILSVIRHKLYKVLSTKVLATDYTDCFSPFTAGGLRRPIVDQEHDMLRFKVPSHGHLLEKIPIQGLSFTTFKEILQFKT